MLITFGWISLQLPLRSRKSSCGGCLNCVGRRADGRVYRPPTLGWETGDWGGAEPLGREALHHAARAEDGRGPATALAELVRGHFGLPTVAGILDASYYDDLQGGVLESVGLLFKRNVRVYVYPQRDEPT